MINTREIAGEYRLAHWAQVIEERIRSELSIKMYCQQIGIATNTYYYWQRRLREAACEQLIAIPVETTQTQVVPCEFTEVKMESDVQIKPETVSITHRSHIRLEAAGVRISADSAYPLKNLAALLRELVRT